MSNPFNYLDEDEKAQAKRYSELLQAERYWNERATQVIGENRNTTIWLVMQARARYLYQLRVEHTIY